MSTSIHRCEFAPSSKPIKAAVTKIGGNPALLSPIEWPVCGQCGAALQFLAQLSLEKPFNFKVPFSMAYVFICPNDQSCDTADPEGGANVVILQKKARSLLGTKTVAIDSPAAALPEWGCAIEKVRHNVEEDGEVPKVAGQPDWIQDDETPQCTGCGEAMTFVAQILAELPEPVIPPPVKVTKMNGPEAVAAVEKAIRSSSGNKVQYVTCDVSGRNAIGINGMFIGSVRVHDTFPVTLQVMKVAAELKRDLEMQVAGTSKYLLPFGDAGIGYTFMCTGCPEGRGAFLWQTT